MYFFENLLISLHLTFFTNLIHSFFSPSFFIFSFFPSNPDFITYTSSSCWGQQSSLCSPYDIIQCRLQPVYTTVQVLVALDTTSLDRKQEEEMSATNPPSSGGSDISSLVSVSTQTPPPVWQIWDLIGSSLLHICCLVLLFMAYSWMELT